MIDQFDEITPEIKENVAQSYRDAWGYEEIGFDATKLVIAGLLLYFGHSFLSSFYSILLVAIVRMTNHTPHAANISSFAGLLGGITCVIIFLIVIRKYLKPILAQFKKGENWTKALKYVGLMYAAILIYSVFLTILRIQSTSANQDSINSMMYLTPFIAGLYVCILAPLIEEFAFRFCLFRGIGRKNEKVAFWVIACIFAGMHLLTSLTTGTFLSDLSSLPVYLVGGIGLTYAYYKEKNVSVPIIAHFIYNSISFLMNVITMSCIL